MKGTSAIESRIQPDYMLLTTKNGITGTFTDDNTNSLLTSGGDDYTGMITTANINRLVYGIKWNDQSGDSCGTFDMKNGVAFGLGGRWQTIPVYIPIGMTGMVKALPRPGTVRSF